MEGTIRRALDDLCWHWSGAYVITVSPDGTRWRAKPRGRGETLTATSGEQLREAIRADYWKRSRLRLARR